MKQTFRIVAAVALLSFLAAPTVRADDWETPPGEMLAAFFENLSGHWDATGHLRYLGNDGFWHESDYQLRFDLFSGLPNQWDVRTFSRLENGQTFNQSFQYLVRGQSLFLGNYRSTILLHVTENSPLSLAYEFDHRDPLNGDLIHQSYTLDIVGTTRTQKIYGSLVIRRNGVVVQEELYEGGR